ncbi:hypothetical protein [Timonella sp. A28]|uniref:hypothetical protein n=1 Tax=Timonella sp. A28 TaxID=3442640 RepID=UPI003EC0DD7D
MSMRLQAALFVWAHRKDNAQHSTAYSLYTIIFVGLIVLLPVLYALWMIAVSPEGIAALTSSYAPTATAHIIVGLWTCALLIGRERGPALLPPVLLHVFASSDIARTRMFMKPVSRAFGGVVLATTFMTSFVGCVLLSDNHITLHDAIVFSCSGVLVGVVTACAWLAGQALPKVSGWTALVLMMLAGTAAYVPAFRSATPWWWGSYPGADHSGDVSTVLLALVACVLLAFVPKLLNAMHIVRALDQAHRWETATQRVIRLEMSAAAQTYQRHPTIARKVHALRPHSVVATTLFVRDAVGALRTPSRLIVGSIVVISAGVLFGVATHATTPDLLVAGIAGILLFFGVNPFMPGLTHALHTAGGVSMYGLSDESLVAQHAIFPTVTLTALLIVGVCVGAFMFAGPMFSALGGVLILSTFTVLTRIIYTIKGPMPPVLLTPIPTPMGDMSVYAQAVWVCDGIICAALVGVAAVTFVQAPQISIAVAVVLSACGVMRWKNRR